TERAPSHLFPIEGGLPFLAVNIATLRKKEGGYPMSALTRWEPTMTRWNPFKELEEMEKRLSTYFNRPALRTEPGKEAMTVAEWSPLVDITEDDKEYLIKADLPEVKKEDVKLTVQDDVM